MEKLEERIVKDIMSAMKSKDEIKLSALRSVKTAVQNEKTSGTFHELTDADVTKIIQKQIKQRIESEEIYHSAGRNELAEKEEKERLVLEEYIPKQLTEEELNTIVNELVKSLNATTIKDMGKVMGELNKQYAGRVDGKKASVLIKSLLN